MRHADDLLAAFDLEAYRCIHLIGGGGKTTLMLAMASALAGRGKRVVATTSTRIRRSEGEAFQTLLIGTGVAALAEQARAALDRQSPVVLASSAQGDKLLGFPVAAVDALAAAGIADALLVEADGAAGRPLKAHAPWEPVIAPSVDLVVVVVGAWCLGQPLDACTVHRPELLARRLGCPPGTPLTAHHVAVIVFHEEGYLAKVPREAHVVLAVTSRDGRGGELARELAAADGKQRLRRVVQVAPVMVALPGDAG